MAKAKGPKLLTQYLDQNGLSLTDFAKLVECSKQYISMLKNGHVTPGLSLAARIEEETAGEIPCKAWV